MKRNKRYLREIGNVERAAQALVKMISRPHLRGEFADVKKIEWFIRSIFENVKIHRLFFAYGIEFEDCLLIVREYNKYAWDTQTIEIHDITNVNYKLFNDLEEDTLSFSSKVEVEVVEESGEYEVSIFVDGKTYLKKGRNEVVVLN